MSMWSRIFLVVATLAITCLVMSHQLPLGCSKPFERENLEILDMYVQCLKSASEQRYGKRSMPNRSTLLKKLHPRLAQDFSYPPSQNLQNLQELYQLLKQDSN